MQPKQTRRYLKLGAQALAERIRLRQEEAFGLAHKQLSTIYSLAIKEKKLSAATQAVNAMLKLMGFWPSARGGPANGRPQELTSDAMGLSDVERQQRLAQIIDYESRGEEAAIELMMNGMPAEYFRVADIVLLHWQLHILMDCHLNELMEQTAMLQHAQRMAASDETARWDTAARMVAYAYQINVEGWNEFTRSIGVDSSQLLGHQKQQKSLDRLCDPLIDQPISRQQLQLEMVAAGM